ncbi:MAG TPA: hypothetical protein VGV17_24730 [Bosea sp. (in: a-proteobacteria)]|jgi:hypothetical protein|uniref:hypothetical protein n=1 Tax=Bosea sp. (in: a-proteobacteria) TaxID=1871050 RepID=UPI002B46E4B6|nr:hypothetical protein [Bosea sp. (in: a-proteobacteria)]WRH58487.1 MAG: hypothetical protein RSE11_01465 [Bosea sp. (in: a-proteobacteria)]HEV2556967.1 hypothetical protein [Bosea sp. (in: a-proteobacteria)]
MTELITWLSVALQLWEIGWPFRGQVRTTRTEMGEVEINLGFYRRRVCWTQRRVAKR